MIELASAHLIAAGASAEAPVVHFVLHRLSILDTRYRQNSGSGSVTSLDHCIRQLSGAGALPGVGSAATLGIQFNAIVQKNTIEWSLECFTLS